MGTPFDASVTFGPHGRFRPLALLGRGAMGLVYRVVDTETQAEVALKTFAVADPEQLYRLKQEFRVLTDLSHPHLVELYELVSGEDGSFFTMEYVDGTDFLQAMHDTGAGPDDEGARGRRIADAAGQLAQGVLALHEAGRLHRDIKPSNVLVARDGRVVLLDFGLATLFDGEATPHYGAAIAGTYAYMAPEILRGAGPSAEADWYSVGALLFETLTGKLAIEATMSGRDPLRNARLPASWKPILSSLLSLDPSERHAGAMELGSRWRGTPRSFDGGARTFVGRDAEVAFLERAFETSARTGRLVHVTGRSGIGKSELLRHVLGRIARGSLHADDGLEAAVLFARCHPDESVPYKAFDSAIDRLSRVLREDDGLAASCLPEDSAALRRLFPVLDRVGAFASAARTLETHDPLESRRRAFAAVRELLARLATARRVVLWIDDFQWSDTDSVLLLREILRPPSPPVLVLLSYRSEDASSSETLRQLADLPLDEEPLRLELGPLPDVDGAALLSSLGALPAEFAARFAGAIREAEGNPFLLSQLLRSAQDGATSSRLSDVVGSRIADLPAAARSLLETVSVAGGPLPRSVALEAAGLDQRGRLIASGLEKRSLLRRAPADAGVGIEIYHDRIREAVLERLPTDAKRVRHGDLADVLERQPEPDPEALYRHSVGAGRRGNARRWAEVGADRAANSLAFQRAAELYGEASLLCDEAEPAWPLVGKRADALANGGHALEAARVYEEAARLASAGGAARNVLTLRQRAANHYLQTGHLDEGMHVMREVLAHVGVRYPRTQVGALLSSLRHRWQLARRGFEHRIRDEPLDEALQLRLDASWSAGITLGNVDPVASDSISVRHAIDALDSGDFLHITRAVGGEAARTSQLRGAFLRRRAARLAAMMDQFVRLQDVPVLTAQLHSVRGMIAFQAARWRDCWEEFSRSSTILRRDCFGVTWEMATIETFGLSALAHMGRFRQLAGLLPRSIGNAADRGDLYASLLFHTGVLNLLWLARDEGEEALSVADDKMARWPASDRFQVQHYVHLIAAVNADLFRGDPWSAFRRMQQAWPNASAALFLQLESARVELRNARARAALAAAVSPVTAVGATAPDPSWSRVALLRLVSAEAKRLARIDSVASARPFATLLEAGVLAAQGRRDEAAATYRSAHARLQEIEMGLYAAAAAHRAAALCDGDARAALLATAGDWADSQDVRAPEKMFAVMAPRVAVQ